MGLRSSGGILNEDIVIRDHQQSIITPIFNQTPARSSGKAWASSG